MANNKFMNLVGQRFGRLVVFELDPTSGTSKKWFCKCDCGNTKRCPGTTLRSGRTISCGCIRVPTPEQKELYRPPEEFKPRVAVQHGLSYTPTFRSWASARNRCKNEYRDNGIEMRFASVADLVADIGEKPAPHPTDGKYTLDRYPDNEGHYEPGNVRWATMKQQIGNLGQSKCTCPNCGTTFYRPRS